VSTELARFLPAARSHSGRELAVLRLLGDIVRARVLGEELVQLLVGDAVDGRAFADSPRVDADDVVAVENLGREDLRHVVGEVDNAATGAAGIDEQTASALSLRSDDLDRQLERLAVRLVIVDGHLDLGALAAVAVGPLQVLLIEPAQALGHSLLRFILTAASEDDHEDDGADEHDRSEEGQE
jgi:hypothetical protein